MFGWGKLGCMLDGQFPAENMENCHGSGCPGNMECYFLDADATESICIESCSAR